MLYSTYLDPPKTTALSPTKQQQCRLRGHGELPGTTILLQRLASAISEIHRPKARIELFLNDLKARPRGINTSGKYSLHVLIEH